KLSRCYCEKNKQVRKRFQEEYETLYLAINRADKARKHLENSPFRQLRNAYGFSMSAFGGVNLLLGSAISAAVTIPPLAVFITAITVAALSGGYVYSRGYQEEQEINDDTHNDLTAKKIALMSAHRNLVSKRYDYPHILNHSSVSNDFLDKYPLTKRKRP